MTFSVHYLKNKIAWIDPRFLDQQLEELTGDKKTVTTTNSNTPIRVSLLTNTTEQTIEINSPARTRKSPQKPTLAENLELNDLKVRLKSTLAENTQLNNQSKS